MSRSVNAEAIEAETFAPFWLVSGEAAPDEIRTMALRIFGHVPGGDDIRADAVLPFAARSVLTTRPDIGLMSCFAPVTPWTWPARRNGREARYILVRPSDGRCVIEQEGRRVSLRARDAAVLDLAQETRFTLVELGRIDLIALDPARLPPLAQLASDELMRAIPRGNRGLQVLAHYGALLLRGLFPLNSAPLRDLAIGHVHDLIGVMLADRSAPPVTATPRRGGRLAAIKADIETRLERRELSVDMIAGLYGVTPRAIQKAFGAEGRTFSDYVMERRLERAWLKLTSAEDDAISISSVAFECGFGDLSYFNRSFRKRFGRSPSQVRTG
ncbi:helix-turn-helix transcriptional regulator [Bosea sp. Root483D1]|uniref:helix-turn-helix transcriptional regulator n=1 Tax=Bosea sp. Root483D1 TaxID=1736544 RepID=UPI000A434D78|nr:AraC family transcriptional regulator [Bosea sp. Root483D1]